MSKNKSLPEIPPDLQDDRVLGLPLCAVMSGRHYKTFLEMAKAGKVGPLLRLGSRRYGIRLRDFRKFQREHELTAA